MADCPVADVLVEFLFVAMVYFGIIAVRDYDAVQGGGGATAMIEVLRSNACLAMLAFVTSYVFYFNIFPVRYFKGDSDW